MPRIKTSILKIFTVVRFLKPVIYELLPRWLQITIWLVTAFKEMLLQKIEVYAQVAIFMGHQSSKNKAIF